MVGTFVIRCDRYTTWNQFVKMRFTRTPTTTSERRDLYPVEKEGTWGSKLLLISIRSDNMQLFEFTRHRLKFNENSPAIKLLDAMYIDDDGSSTSQLCCFVECDMVLSISFNLTEFRMLYFVCSFSLREQSQIIFRLQ